MTLVIGLVADDGLVIASDSQMSMGTTQRSGRKVYLSSNNDFAFGLAGNEATMQSLRDALIFARLGEDSSTVREKLRSIAVNTMIPMYDVVRSAHGGQVPAEQLPIAEAIVGVYCEGEPHVFHIGGDCLVTDLSEGFASTGWGKPFADHAEATFHELRENLTCYQCEMLCYRVIRDAIHVSGPNWMLGGPIQIARVQLVEGRPRAIRRDNDVQELRDAVDSWVRLEAERFREHQPGG